MKQGKLSPSAWMVERLWKPFSSRSEEPALSAGEERFRNELKYVCSEGELQQILARVRPLCRPDSHAGPGGIYSIRSVYFDDRDDTCFYENENGVDPREKFRIRIYNGSDDRITLECKRKERAMTHKASCPLTRERCEEILAGHCAWTPADPPLLRKFYAQYAQDCLRPKVIVAYERTPFVYPAGNVRITFDRNIGSTADIGGFFRPYLPLRPVLPTGRHVLEVKYDEFLPEFLYSVMNLGSLRQSAFSKYYLCRRFTVWREET